ncbi:MAG: ATP-binding protein [Candidatus Kerfeldbacteria bacterium]|nr:ATP-binding protein [Candidatus Kerfeldbacteria bacterium]
MQGTKKELLRYTDAHLQRIIRNGGSCFLLGPRQVGKTTLVKHAVREKQNAVEYSLQDPSIRIDLEADPSRMIREVRARAHRPIVFVDEAQKVPPLFDAAQLLIDNREAQFILTGSSARKLRRSGANLLPGRLTRLFLDPLLWGELGFVTANSIPPLRLMNINRNIPYTFEDMLVFGSLPGIVALSRREREERLRSYAEIYLEEEIRAEALSRKIGAFSRFLELAAAESGTSPNLTKLSNESGVSQPSIRAFYEILEDTLVVERVEPYLKNARKRVLSSPRHYFFDLGVRNALARLPLDHRMINAQKGILFEHAIILEIIRRIRVLNKPYRVCFWRTSGGAEVDCVIDMGTRVIPIEIKASAHVIESEVKGLKNFLIDYRRVAKEGYVITLGKRREKIAKNITAIPWSEL